MDEAGDQASLEVLKQGVPSQVTRPRHHQKGMHKKYLSKYESEKVIQLCLIFCDPMDYTVHGIL